MLILLRPDISSAGRLPQRSTGFWSAVAKFVGCFVARTTPMIKRTVSACSIISPVFVAAYDAVVSNFLQPAVQPDRDFKLIYQLHKLHCGSAGVRHEVAEIRQHFNHGHILAALLEIYCRFDADGAGTNYYNFITNLHLACIGMGRPMHVGFCNAREIWHYRFSADGDYNGVILLGVKNFLCGLGTQEYSGARFVCLPYKPVEVVSQILLEIGQNRIIESSAKALALLIERNIVSSLHQCEKGLDSSGSAADDGHLLLYIRLGNLAQREHILFAQIGVDGAVDDGGIIRRLAQLLAAQAGAIILLGLSRIFRHLGIGQQGTAHGYKVRLPEA